MKLFNVLFGKKNVAVEVDPIWDKLDEEMFYEAMHAPRAPRSKLR